MNIDKLAKQAGINNDCDGIWCNADQLQHFAELVAAHTLMNIDPSKFIGGYQEGFEAGVAKEREECAKLFDDKNKGSDGYYDLQEPAEIIRARSKA